MKFKRGKKAIARDSWENNYFEGQEIYLDRDADDTTVLFRFVDDLGDDQLLEAHEFYWADEEEVAQEEVIKIEEKGVVDMRNDNNSENPYVENEDVEAVANRARMQFLANLIDQRLESGFYKTNYDEFKELVDDYIECKKKDTENSKEYVKKLKK